MNVNNILKEQIGKIRIDSDELLGIKKVTIGFCKEIALKLKRKKIDASVFIGGSLAKGTIIKKGKQDIDIFVRFGSSYIGKDISKILGRVLSSSTKKIHGSRDYYQIVREGVLLEVVPVLRINRPSDAENITDLSYFHVNYVLEKIKKNKKLGDEIILTKSFLLASGCYGAESYIHGFSGYAIELLICYYGSLVKFLRAMVSQKKEKIIIDDSKFYRSKGEVLREMNESKLKSPIILVDPTFKERNALAGLNDETFEKFKKYANGFLKSPSLRFFEKKDVAELLIKKYGSSLNVVSVRTNKQRGDIAGTKSLKFFDFFSRKLEREFDVKVNEFKYDGDENIATFYFVVSKKKDSVIKGPHKNKIKNIKAFRKVHRGAYEKGGYVYARVKHGLSFGEWIKKFKVGDKKIIGEMSIKSVGLD